MYPVWTTPALSPPAGRGRVAASAYSVVANSLRFRATAFPRPARGERDRVRGLYRTALAAADEGHLGGHYGEELDVGFGRDGRHQHDRAGDVFDVHHRLDHGLAVGLRHAAGHALRHLGQRVADIDLAARDVVFAAVERGRPGEAGDGVLRRRIGDRERPRHVRRDRAVVDDPAAHRLLVLHDAEGLLRAQEGAVHDRIDDTLPLRPVEVLDRGG